MRDVTFEDYLMQGPLAAIAVVREITGAPKVNILSVCLGGTLTAIGLAYLAREGDDSVNSATFLNSHTDFTRPGQLGVFTDETTIAGLERKMAKLGYLEAADMARTFDALRANDLIFSYVVNNWLLGNQPPSFDLLGLERRQHPDAGEDAFDLSTHPATCAMNSPEASSWSPGSRSTQARLTSTVTCSQRSMTTSCRGSLAYQTTQLLGGKPRFVLSSSGHIAGIVNPPNPKASHWTNDQLPADADEWLESAVLRRDTWWEDWAEWIAERAGPMVRPRKTLGSRAHPPMGNAPGTYVQTKAG